MKAFKFRLYPDKKTAKVLNNWFGQTRFVWNYYLDKRTVFYKENGKGLSYADNSKNLTQLKKQPDFNWLNECPAQALQQSLKHLDSAFKNFFSRGRGYPHFKKKSISIDSLHFPQRFKVNSKNIVIPKIKKPIKMKRHRDIKGNIRSIVVSRNKANQYFVSILTDYIPCHLFINDRKIGLDVGLKDFCATSDGNKYKMPHFINQNAYKLKILQRRLSKKKKDSNNRNKARLKIAKLQQHISNQRQDFLHKLSTKLINENQVIAVEDLCIKGMLRNHRLAKHIANASWSKFFTFLDYKANWHGRDLLKLDRFFPSSKMCNKCGYIKEDLKLSDRIITCKRCGSTYDRDINAAKNILTFATVGTTGIACGEPSVRISHHKADN